MGLQLGNYFPQPRPCLLQSGAEHVHQNREACAPHLDSAPVSSSGFKTSSSTATNKIGKDASPCPWGNRVPIHTKPSMVKALGVAPDDTLD